MGFGGHVGASFIFGQNTYDVKWKVPGVREFELAYDGTLSYSGGGVVGYNFKPQFGLEWQAGYATAGMKYEDTDRNGVIHRKQVDLRYATIGMAVRYSAIFKKNRYKQKQKVRLAIVAGPRIGIRTKGSLTYSLELPGVITVDDAQLNYPYEFPDYNDSDVYTNPTGSDDAFFNKIDVGLVVRVGVDIFPSEYFYISPAVTGYLGIADINASEFRIHDGYGASHTGDIGFQCTMGFYLSRRY